MSSTKTERLFLSMRRSLRGDVDCALKHGDQIESSGTGLRIFRARRGAAPVSDALVASGEDSRFVGNGRGVFAAGIEQRVAGVLECRQ